MGKFYEYDQNNSGGHFDVDEKVCHRLLIEADNLDAADEKAEELGCYWNGVSEGSDCPCCGDRWYSSGWNMGIEFPYKYSTINEKEIETYKSYGATIDEETPKFWVTFPTPESYMQCMADKYGWTKPDGRIFYLDGRVVDIYSKKIK